MKPPKPIARYKISTCLTCGKEAPTTAGRCIGSPYCYEKHRKEVRDARNAECGTEAVIKPKKPINKVSDKQARLNALYAVAATQYKKDNKFCKARLSECQIQTHHVHHLFSGASRSKYYLDQTTWLPVCNSCHAKIHDVMSKDELIALDLKRVE